MLTLYRRHTSACLAKLGSLPAKARRLYMDCQCPIWIYGRTDNGVCPRHATGTTDLKQAEALRASLDARGKSVQVHGPTLEDCVTKYKAARQHVLTDRVQEHYELLLGRFKRFCEGQGVFFMRGLSVDLLERFKLEGLPPIAETTRRTATAKLKSFLREAFRRGWLLEPLHERVMPHHAPFEQKSPFGDSEIARLLEGADQLKSPHHGYPADPHTFRLLIELMLQTGLRLGDALRYDPRQAQRGEHLWVYVYTPQKTKKIVQGRSIEAFLGDSLKLAIDGCLWLSKERPFLTSNSPHWLGGKVWCRMQAVGSNCGIEDCRPHRLRDTFAVRALLRGVPLEDVSRLLGHASIRTTEMFYAAWVPARKLRLEKLLAESLANQE